MSVSIYPFQAKAILFLLTSRESFVEEVLEHFIPLLGPVELQSAWHPFPKGHYYEGEMGKNLQRSFVGFKNIFEPHTLAALKGETTRVEKEFSINGKRTINIDPGYVDLFKMVLASNKSGGQKIALAKGIYAYPLLRFEQKKWLPFPWTYPDFKMPDYHEDLLKIRESLKGALATLSPDRI